MPRNIIYFLRCRLQQFRSDNSKVVGTNGVHNSPLARDINYRVYNSPLTRDINQYHAIFRYVKVNIQQIQRINNLLEIVVDGRLQDKLVFDCDNLNFCLWNHSNLLCMNIKSKKTRKYNGNRKRKNNDIQNTTYKLIIKLHETTKSQDKLRCTEG